jgi:cystathionine beta-lyase/cystathionine gamma-synthase
LGARDFHDIAAFVDAFIAASPEGTYIAPSFGGNTPLVSAVAVVSHFQQTPAERAARGIPDDLMRIALGTQSKESLTKAFEAGFAALAARQGLN